MESEFSQTPPCCFCFSTKKNQVKQSKKDKEVSGSIETEWGKNGEILSDLSTFSVKEQEKRLKKALKEEESRSKEAVRIVNWVKQESAKMDTSSAIKNDSNDN
ncbi:Vitellogenin-2 protein [Quillaja saponaria]|uniref:Vitellogenin-2 protein n=1 Tax=Quillaja saponaria TaxID=32244 RepID=A0AAD7P6Q3_QUISA|nr:Vitellogenin-2 protein [Quillaja saponaria]